MERIFAGIRDNVIVNTFVADDDFIALVASDYDSVREVTDEDPMPGISWTAHADGYRPPQPYASWSWNDGEWVAPKPMPDAPGSWAWDETTQDWFDVFPPKE